MLRQRVTPVLNPEPAWPRRGLSAAGAFAARALTSLGSASGVWDPRVGTAGGGPMVGQTVL